LKELHLFIERWGKNKFDIVLDNLRIENIPKMDLMDRIALVLKKEFK